MKAFVFQVMIAADTEQAARKIADTMRLESKYANFVEVMVDAPREFDMNVEWIEVEGYDLPAGIDPNQEVQIRTESMLTTDGTWYLAGEMWTPNRKEISLSRITHYRTR